jgi:hypothetical protein
MYWRMPRREFEASLGAGMRQLFRPRVEAGPPAGLLAYRAALQLAGSKSVRAPMFPGWNGERRLTAPTAEAPDDDPRVWGVSCFVTRAGCPRQGIATALLAGGFDWACQNGARVLDACPAPTVRSSRCIRGWRRRSAEQAFAKLHDNALIGR